MSIRRGSYHTHNNTSTSTSTTINNNWRRSSCCYSPCWMMRSGSSRLFIVLLHLVGVRTNLPLSSSWSSGIVGVHPVAIVLEKLPLDPARGLEGLLRKMPAEHSEGILSDPYWLQDDSDGRCMGPSGFAECGDSTLWVLHRKRSRSGKRRNILSDLFSVGSLSKQSQSQNNNAHSNYNHENSGFALQMIDTEVIPSTTASTTGGGPVGIREFVKRQIFDKKSVDLDCLMIDKKKKPRQKKKRSRTSITTDTATATATSIADGHYSLKLGSCADNPLAWGWRIDGHGVLYHANWVKSKKASFLCLWRTSPSSRQSHHTASSHVVVAPCQSSSLSDSTSSRIVEFSLVRYRTNPTVPLSNNLNVLETAKSTEPQLQLQLQHRITTSNTVPHSMSSSESHAKLPPNLHPELKPMSSLLFTPLSKESQAVSILKASNPIMMSSEDWTKVDRRVLLGALSSSSSSSSFTPPSSSSHHHNNNNNDDVLHLPISSSSVPTITTVAPPRKIPVHPYLATAKNNVWTDPQTGLEFPMDLTEYLGFAPKAYGKHTLMGVGQYTKTVLKVKVYGVGFYVSKRDVLADGVNFSRFATQSTAQLQQNHDFYQYLQVGNFDKTLFLVLNMQLSVDTICETLDADWSMLDPAAKEDILRSLSQPHQAEARALRHVAAAANTSNCSCSLSTPPEYGADRRCCARGTEMVFTWNKNGDLVVRLNGQVLENLSGRADIGRGIFYEYLNPINPMSFDSLWHFADGFPYLLAPLAQVQGVTMNDGHQHHHNSRAATSTTNTNNFNIDGVLEFIDTAASASWSWVRDQAPGRLTMTDVQDFWDRRRSEATHHVNVASTRTVNFVLQRTPGVPATVKDKANKKVRSLSMGNSKAQSQAPSSNKESSETASFSDHPTPHTTTTPLLSEQWCHRHLLAGGSCGNVPRYPNFHFFFGGNELADEIGAKLHPTSNFSRKLFAYTVHLYLMLLFFVSLPESSTSRTTTVVRRKMLMRNLTGCRSSSSSGGGSDDDEEEEELELDRQQQREHDYDENENDNDQQQPLTTSGRTNMPKSFSYYL